ncbi:MAG TPA: PIN domain-containing protein [Streptosporangiaceae bacterium]|nr:PIN domain-containing protein [Streptosporangiaceae bacterium]
MILVDTSVWVDHLHVGEPALAELLEQAEVCRHPMVIAELALGTMRDRRTVLGLLGDLPGVSLPAHDEVLRLVESSVLYGKGLSVVDAHLLAAARINDDVRIWTRDKRLRAEAERLNVAAVGLT